MGTPVDKIGFLRAALEMLKKDFTAPIPHNITMPVESRARVVMPAKFLSCCKLAVQAVFEGRICFSIPEYRHYL